MKKFLMLVVVLVSVGTNSVIAQTGEPIFESVSAGTNQNFSMIFYYGEGATSIRLERAENPLLAFQPMAPGELVSTIFLPSNRVEFVVDMVALRTAKRVFRAKVVRNTSSPAPTDVAGAATEEIKKFSDPVMDEQIVISSSVDVRQDQSMEDSGSALTDLQIMEEEDRLIAKYL